VPRDYATRGPFIEAAIDGGGGSVTAWQPASQIARSAKNSSLLEVQFTKGKIHRVDPKFAS
jgi:hypothetical protein